VRQQGKKFQRMYLASLHWKTDWSATIVFGYMLWLMGQ